MSFYILCDVLKRVIEMWSQQLFCIVIVSTMNIFRIFVLIIILTIKLKTLLNMKKYLSLILLLVMASGCTQDVLVEIESSSIKGRIFSASFDQDDTRTYVEEGNLLRWNAGDQISLFDGNTLNSQYQFDGETGDNAGTFSLVNAPFGTVNDLSCHYALYPYKETTSMSDNGTISYTFPDTQNYAENSFGLGANTMVAVTKDTDDTFLKFKNVGGYLKLQLYGEDVVVKSITLKGNNDEKLAGNSTITPIYGQDPTIGMANNARTSITLDCGDGVRISTTEDDATVFWFVVPPITFESGFTIVINNTIDMTFSKSTTNVISIERNVIQPMAAFEVEIDKIPNNEIRYTASEKVRPYYDDEFGAKIEYNSFNPWTGEGVIKFYDDVTEIGYYAFWMCTELKSIYIPSSVEDMGMLALYGCKNLKKIYCLGIDPPKGADRMFTYQHADRKIYVPMEAVDKYKKAWYWSDYDSRIEGYIK